MAMNTRLAALAGAIALTAGAAHAHPGHDHAYDLARGFAHPFLGLDHLLAMVAVGLWAAQRGGRAVWALPAAFVAGMALGGALGMAGIPLIAVEAGVALSVLVLGSMVAGSSVLSLSAGVMVVSLFAFMHGHAHGAETGAGGGAAGYAAGLLIATALLHASGVAGAISLRKLSSAQWVRYSGGAIAAAGLAMIVGLI